MHAELRSLHSPDLDLQHETPADPEDFTILVQAFIGQAGKPGEDAFSFQVCTPRSLEDTARRQLAKGFWFARNLLVLERYDYQVLCRAIIGLCRSTSGRSWDEISVKLSRWGAWEFEEYQPLNERAQR